MKSTYYFIEGDTGRHQVVELFGTDSNLKDENAWDKLGDIVKQPISSSRTGTWYLDDVIEGP